MPAPPFAFVSRMALATFCSYALQFFCALCCSADLLPPQSMPLLALSSFVFDSRIALATVFASAFLYFGSSCSRQVLSLQIGLVFVLSLLP